MLHLLHRMGGPQHRSQNLVVVAAAAQIARNPLRQFRTRRLGISLQVTDRRHDESRHTEGALESLFIHHRLLHRMQLAAGSRQTFDGGHFTLPDGMGENRT
jgi:hypothetical protein